jgi:3-methylcrotonyl-CoA carboxylase alpha subunit
MLAKLIASAASRDAAIARAIRALRDFPILGVRTNISFLVALLDHASFREGTVDTGFVERHVDDLISRPDPSDAIKEAAAFAAAERVTAAPYGGDAGSRSDPWLRLTRWGR